MRFERMSAEAELKTTVIFHLIGDEIHGRQDGCLQIYENLSQESMF